MIRIAGQLLKTQEVITKNGTTFYKNLILDDDDPDMKVLAVTSSEPLEPEVVKNGVPCTFGGLFDMRPQFKHIAEE